MEIPSYQPFYLDTLEALSDEIARLGLNFPLAENHAALTEPLAIDRWRIPNRFCAQPITGCDATPDGAPGELTLRRYRRYAEGGFGLIWIESTFAGATAATGSPAQLRLHKGSLNAFAAMLQTLRKVAASDPAIILQLTAAPASQPLTDDDVGHRGDEMIHAATLAATAGFDGIDLQCSHGALAGTLLSAFERPGKYGGSFENRSRFLLETLAGIHSQTPGLLLATRLCAYDAVRQGFGVSASDYRKPDLAEAVLLVQLLRESGLSLLNVTACSPNLRGPVPERPRHARSDSENPDEHPLMVLDRQLRIAGALRAAAPELAVVGSGFSWLRQFVPAVATGALDTGMIDLAGLGRSALAYPDAPLTVGTALRAVRELDSSPLARPEAPAETLARSEAIGSRGLARPSETAPGEMSPAKSCIVCSACSLLHSEGEPVGCVIRDPAIYGPIYRSTRRYDADNLLAGARRCHFCEAAPCAAASPTRTDIPAFIRAYLQGDEKSAYEIIRASDPLPELTSRLAPGWLESEGACIETTLTGTPVPILDLQYAISWRARDRGETGVRVPHEATGKNIAIVGGGPAGLAATVHLVECGHTVQLFESSDRLGGTPERAIPSERISGTSVEVQTSSRAFQALDSAPQQFSEISAELQALLQPALAASRLHLHYRATLGENTSFDDLRTGHHAVLLAAGLWREPSLGQAPGVIPSLTFLEAAKREDSAPMPERVALLAGGDSAMDAARVAQSLGANELFVIFGGPRSAMHWHLPESWFATPGVHAMMSWQPIGYDLDGAGRLEGVRLRHTELHCESVLPVGLVIEAMGLEVAASMRTLGLKFTAEGRVSAREGGRTNLDRIYAAGAVVNGGASVGQCIAEGLTAARAIQQDLEMARR